MPLPLRSSLVRAVLFALLTIASAVPAFALPIEPGVSRALAASRSGRISGLQYRLSFELRSHAATIPGRETLTFRDTGSGDLPLDFRDGDITSALLNGQAIPRALQNGHLNLPAAALLSGPNELQLTFTTHAAPAGKAITRFEDKDDGSEYLYTLFVPMDASMAFPCFDQPDLKARFSLQISAPSAWSVVSNTAPVAPPRSDGGFTSTLFSETQPISTYLFAFAAGPFERIPGKAPGEPTLYVRKSQLARAQAEPSQVQQITSRGVKYLEDYFQQPFPFPKYDLVLIPGFPFGGMEHAGATFLNEDGVLFRTAPTQADYFRRNILVLHETTHQWFGDLVTMRWFDDLWLKEGFAQYMAYHALAELEPSQQPWKHFYEDIKPLAYGIDETQGTTPIFQNIANLKDAKSAYGAIVYQKAPAVMKQLEYRIGSDTFRDGLRLYLRQHAYANAQWADLIGAFESASTAAGHPQDVKNWASAWIVERGMPQVEASWTCKSGMIDSLILSQQNVLAASDKARLWPISNELLFVYPKEFSRASDSMRVDWNTASYKVTAAIGHPCPRYLFANSGDHAYGRFLLDATSEPNVIRALADPEPEPQTPLLRTQLWGALWENVHVAKSASRAYVELTLKTLPTESDETLNRIQGSRIATALHAYFSAKSRGALAPRVEAVIADRMLNAPTLGLRIVNFRTFTSVAETPSALRQLKDILAGNLKVPNLTLRPLDRWNIIGHLIAQNDPEAAQAFTHEKASDHSGEAQKYAYTVEAGAPLAATKSRYFEEYLHSPDRQEDWITQSLHPFNNWNQTALTEPFLARALDAIPDIKSHRKIFLLGAWLSAFIDGQNSPAAQAAVHAWLATAKIDPDLRLKVLEVSDALDRTVFIRSKFPE